MLRKVTYKLNARWLPAIYFYLLKNKFKYHKIFILQKARLLFGESFIKQDWLNAINEIKEKKVLTHNSDINSDEYLGNSFNTLFGKWLYCLNRVTKPDIILETGVAHGNSSLCILNALAMNGRGRLISIDLPNNDTDKPYNVENFNKEPGWIIPDSLRDNWDLQLGDSKKILPELLKDLKKIDVFFHDSDHSYENMKFEFNAVRKYMKNGGLILSDDIDKNTAFDEFINENDFNAISFISKGATIKT
jgi:predicted O-methyltransferase YrrM